MRAYQRKYDENHKKEAHNYRKTHKKECNEYNRKRCAANPEKTREANRKRSRKWAKENPEKRREANGRWAKANPEKHRARNAKRRALKAKVTVGDLTAIAAIYDKAQNSNRVRCYLCGKVIPKGERHVDHIIPLSKGGLHTASNLAVACAVCNLKKHAKLPEEVGILI